MAKIVLQVVDPSTKWARTIIYDNVIGSEFSIDTKNLREFENSRIMQPLVTELSNTITFNQLNRGLDPHTTIYTEDAEFDSYPDLGVLLPILSDYEVYMKAQEYVTLYESRIDRLGKEFSEETLVAVLENMGYTIYKESDSEED